MRSTGPRRRRGGATAPLLHCLLIGLFGLELFLNRFICPGFGIMAWPARYRVRANTRARLALGPQRNRPPPDQRICHALAQLARAGIHQQPPSRPRGVAFHGRGVPPAHLAGGAEPRRGGCARGAGARGDRARCPPGAGGARGDRARGPPGAGAAVAAGRGRGDLRPVLRPVRLCPLPAIIPPTATPPSTAASPHRRLVPAAPHGGALCGSGSAARCSLPRAPADAGNAHTHRTHSARIKSDHHQGMPDCDPECACAARGRAVDESETGSPQHLDFDFAIVLTCTVSHRADIDHRGNGMSPGFFLKCTNQMFARVLKWDAKAPKFGVRLERVAESRPLRTLRTLIALQTVREAASERRGLRRGRVAGVPPWLRAGWHRAWPALQVARATPCVRLAGGLAVHVGAPRHTARARERERARSAAPGRGEPSEGRRPSLRPRRV